MSKSLKVLYPNYSSKAISFTIDDGNIPMDEKFISITAPALIKGTFNLCSNLVGRDKGDFYRNMYSGYEIANHCKYHPYAMDDSIEYTFCDAQERVSAVADPSRLYPKEGAPEGIYSVLLERGWRDIAETDVYIRCIDESHRELEEVFGEGSVVSYVWPFCEQNNARIKEHLASVGYENIRKTGCTRDTTGFAVPKNRMAWSYNADNRTLLEVARMYEEYPSDGELLAFIFGVHSWDFERDSNWQDLEKFAATYGGRPDDYWYATVREIFDYADAADALVVDGDTVVNPSDLDVYVDQNGKRYVIKAGKSLKI